MPLTLRRGTPADMAIVAEFNRRLALESENITLDPAILSAGVTAVLSDPTKGIYFLAESGGEVVGQTMITYEWSDWRNGWLWWLQSVYVRSDFRRQGVFRMLFDHVLAEGRAAGNVAAVRLYVEHNNHAAQKTYKSLGMTEAGYHVLERYPL